MARRFAAWFAQGHQLPTLAAVQAWHRAAKTLAPVPTAWYGWPKVPGQLLVVNETGWGAVPEIFKSYFCAEEQKGEDGEALGSLVTLQFTSVLPQDEEWG